MSLCQQLVIFEWEPNLRILWQFFVVLLLWLSPAYSQTGAIYDQSCRDLVKAMEQYYADREDADQLSVVWQDPFRTMLQDFMSELTGDAYLRIAGPLRANFQSRCLQSAEARSDETITVRSVLSDIMVLNKLDRSAPDWGLREIPTIDFHIHSMADWDEAFKTIPEEHRGNVYNDFFRTAFTRYMEQYKIETMADFDAASNVPVLLTFEGGGSSQPVGPIIDRLAAEVGLQLK